MGALLLGAALGLVALAWPDGLMAERFPDSIQYLKWPDPVSTDPLMRLGPRPPGYPLFLAAFGAGAGLVYAQVLLSLVAFAGFGYVLARVPGALVGAALTLAPELRVFDHALLSDSLSLSLLVATGALALSLSRTFGRRRFVIWGLLVVWFGAVRPANALAIPFVSFPLLGWLLGVGAPLRWAPTWKRAAAGGVVVLLSVVVAVATVEGSEFWRMNYLSAYMERVIVDPEAVEHFAAAGMPTPVQFSSPDFARWFDQHGRRTYEGWVLSRPESYAVALAWLRPAEQRGDIWRRYVDVVGVDRVLVPGWLEAERLLQLTAPPLGIWLLVVALPGVGALWRGRPSVMSIWPAVLAVGAYLQCFFAYHGSAAEEVRHTLGASMLMRMAFLVALASLLPPAWRRLTSR